MAEEKKEKADAAKVEAAQKSLNKAYEKIARINQRLSDRGAEHSPEDVQALEDAVKAFDEATQKLTGSMG